MGYQKLKNVLTVMLCLLGGGVFSQKFEGTVKWSVAKRLSNPEDQARLEAALKKQQQARQRELAEQKMAENEPKKPESADNIAPVAAQKKRKSPDLPKIPTSMIINIQNGNSLTTMDGTRDRIFLYLEEKDLVYTLNNENKTYRTLRQTYRKDSKRVKAELLPWEKTAETATILNYQCVRYTKSFVEGGELTTLDVWLTDDIEEPNMAVLSKHPVGSHMWNLENLNGVPLKLVESNAEVTTTFQVSEIAEKKVKDDLFSIPTGFKENK